MDHIDIKDTINNINNTTISKSSIHGLGLFSDIIINKDITLCELDGQVIDEKLHNKYKLTFEWNAIGNEKFLVRPYRTKYSYINHSRVPNLKIIYNPIRIITKCKIKQGEELTLDYRSEPLPEIYLKEKGIQYL